MSDVMRLEPVYWQAHKLLGDIFYKEGKYDLAIQAYRKILNSNYNDCVAYNDIAIALMQIERYDQAVMYLKEALRLNPDNLDIMYNLASMYRDAGMYDEAIMEYKSLAKRDDAYPNMYNSLAEIYNTQGEKGLAIEAYYKEIENSNRRLSDNPDSIVEQNILAKAYNGAGECEKAREIIMGVIHSSPSYRDAYITLASIEEREGNFDEAIQFLYTAKSFSKHSGFIDKYISDLKKRSHLVMESEKAQVGSFVPTHLIVFKSGKFIEGILRGQTDDEISMYVQTGETQFKVVVKKSDIERIVEHGSKGPR
jgi:tetratricopeptide (TPR) repeat protein